VSDHGVEASVGSCFGLEMRSPLPFRFLRQGTGITLQVREAATTHGEPQGELVMEWPARGHGGDARLYRDAVGAHLWIDRVGCFDIDPKLPSITVPELWPEDVRSELSRGVPEDQLLAWREVFMLRIPAMLCFMEQGYVPLHAASVDIGGAGLLLSAPGTFGKTTLSGAFHQAGYRLLSDDVSSCGLGDEPVVFPGPALLRVRRDVFDRLSFKDTEVAFETSGRVSLSIEPSRRGNAVPVPLRGIVLLRRSDGEMSLVRADPGDAIRDLFNLCFRGVFDRARAFREVASLVSAVPVWYLARRLDYGELPAVVDRIVTDCVGSRG
jgi:hypothetical protein